MGEYGPRPETKKSGSWKRIKNMAEMAGIATILSFTSPESAPAQEKGEEPHDTKDKTSEVMRLGREKIIKILGLLEIKGQSGVMGTNNPIRRWVVADQGRIEAGYEPDKKTVKWVAVENGDGTKCYVDVGGDGVVDRVVYNKEQVPIARKRAENLLKALSPLDDLAATASTEADLDPQDSRVIDFSKTDSGEDRISSIDYRTGEATELIGDEVKTLFDKVQAGFVNEAGVIEAEMSK